MASPNIPTVPCQGADDANGLSFVDRLIRSQPEHIHKIVATDSTDRQAYYFVWVPASKTRAFLNFLDIDGITDLAAFGRVIASCYGSSPTEETKLYLKERYSFDC